jgi:putative protease
MVGEELGRVVSVQGQSFVLESGVELNNGDGLCWFDEDHILRGTMVNAVQPVRDRAGAVQITPEDMTGIRQGLLIRRNRDHRFLRQVERSRPVRKIGVHLRLTSEPGGLELQAEDEDGNRASGSLTTDLVPARKPETVEATTRRQLAKTGNTPYGPADVELAWEQPIYVPVSEFNALRRRALERLSAVRAANRPVLEGGRRRNEVPYPETRLTFRGNALNRQAVAFYKRHGVEEVAPAAESGLDMRGEIVMRTRYCIKHQLGLCDGRPGSSEVREPYYLVDEDGHRYRLRFDCAACEMEVVY